MSIIVPVRARAHAGLSSFSRSLFESPQPRHRKITVGFTYLQRIAKEGCYEVWFPDELQARIDRILAEGKAIGPECFPAQWAAVRQFELLHESGNHKIYDLDPQMLWRSMLDLSRSMRAGGYRMTVVILGQYEETSTGDELEILDQKLQEGLSQMIHMLYLDEASEAANLENDARLAGNKWNYLTDLPHIGMVLGAGDLFQRRESARPMFETHNWKVGGLSAPPPQPSARKHKLARQFFDVVSALPQSHIIHDTAIGLQLPELNGENQWNYIADPEETLASFNHVLCMLFDKFNGINLSGIHGEKNPRSEVKASVIQMRGFGDHLSGATQGFYQQAALALN